MGLLIAESDTIFGYYHLRIGDGDFCYGGGHRHAVCGAPIAWDTRIPVAKWGSHWGCYRWCPDCTNRVGFPVHQAI